MPRDPDPDLKPDAPDAPDAPDEPAVPSARARGRPRKTLSERDDGNRRMGLIEAAAKLFRQKGFAATATRDIASAVGMRSGSPFYHFKSKDDLLAAVMEQGMTRAIESQQLRLSSLLNSEQQTQQIRRPSADFTSKVLQILVRNHFEVLVGPGSDFIPVMLYEWRSLGDDARARVQALQTQYEAAWRPVLSVLHASGRLRGDEKLARLLIFGALNWTAQWYRMGDAGNPGVATLDELTDSALALFLHDLAPAK